MIPLFRKAREALSGFLEDITRGALTKLPKFIVGRDKILKGKYFDRILDELEQARGEVWKFGPKGYQWIVRPTQEAALGRVLQRNQMHVADVVLVGPDGQMITVDNLFMPTGRAYESEWFERRLAAELKRMENEGLIDPIGFDASGYVRRSTMSFNMYTMTAT